MNESFGQPNTWLTIKATVENKTKQVTRKMSAHKSLVSHDSPRLSL